MSMKTDWEGANQPFKLTRMVYINNDVFGNPVYRFEYVFNDPNWVEGMPPRQVRSMTLSATGSRSQWSFAAPNYNSEAPQAQDQSPSSALQSSLMAAQQGDRIGVLGLNPFGDPLEKTQTSFTQREYDAYLRGVKILERWFAEGRYSEEHTNEQLQILSGLKDISSIERLTNIIPPAAGSAGLDTTGSGFGDFGVGASGGGGGGGRGGGAIGPVYRAPDRRTIEDQVTGQVTNLLGRANDDFIQEFTNLFMKEDRRNFDSPDKQIDAGTSVIEAIRNTEEYKTIHKLRPDSVDERTWISRRRSLGESGGLAESALEDFGIDQATIGGRVSQTAEAGAVRQFRRTNRAPRLLQNQYKTVVADMFSGVVK